MNLKEAKKIRYATNSFKDCYQFCNVCPSFYEEQDGQVDCKYNGRCEDVAMDAANVIVDHQDSEITCKNMYIDKLERDLEEAKRMYQIASKKRYEARVDAIKMAEEALEWCEGSNPDAVEILEKYKK